MYSSMPLLFESPRRDSNHVEAPQHRRKTSTATGPHSRAVPRCEKTVESDPVRSCDQCRQKTRVRLVSRPSWVPELVREWELELARPEEASPVAVRIVRALTRRRSVGPGS